MGQTPLGRDGFAALSHVSRETLDRLSRYSELLIKWNRTINLVGPATIDDLWRRHILDSWQLIPHLRPRANESLADLGSGAGLPGLILAIAGLAPVHLIESDQRKSVFLREAARITGTGIDIHAQRIEDVPLANIGIVTARALAPLDELIALSTRLLAPAGACYFLKGAKAADELTAARVRWRFNATLIPSLSDETGYIVKLENIERE